MPVILSAAGRLLLTVAGFAAITATEGGGGPFALFDFDRDEVIYDSGAAVGREYANVPVFGSGPSGEVVEARALDAEWGIETTPWVPIGTISGGLYSATLQVPLIQPWLRIQTRLQSAPGTILTTANRFAVGYNFAPWGQSEFARGWDVGFNNVATPALVTIKQMVDNLKQPGMCGRTSRATLNVAGPGNLPAGATLVGNVISISGTRIISDWHFNDYQVELVNGASVAFKQCLFSHTDAASFSFLLYARSGSRGWVNDCTFQGSSSFTGVAAAVKEEQTSVGFYGKVILRRCVIREMTNDPMKLVAGSARWCWIYGKRNLDQIPVPWSSATTYAAGDHVINDTSHVYRSIAGGNLNHQPPSGKVTTDSFWALVDPHVDLITVEKTEENVYIEYCLLDFSEMTLPNGGTGSNNYVRFQPNSGTSAWNNAYVRFCIMDRDPTEASSPFQVTTDFGGQVYLYGNWYRPKNGTGTAADIQPTNLGAVHWSGMRHIDTDAFRSAPAGTVDESGSFVDATTDRVIHHVYNDRTPIGSGTVQHKPMTAADRHSPTFAAIANTLLMELCGYKCTVLHHTVSGTGWDVLFDDTVVTPARAWADELALHNFVCVNGAKVGLAYSSWYAATTNYKTSYVEALYELLAKKIWGTGAAITGRHQFSSVNPVNYADHFFGDIYSAADTRWCIMGPHARPGVLDMQNSYTQVGGGSYSLTRNLAQFRENIRARLADTRTDANFVKQGIEPMNWSCATDYLHPDADTLDGLPQFGVQFILGALQAAGIRKWQVPEFDNVFWAPDGSYVEVWSSAGPVTTTRKVRGMSAIGTTHTHWTDVFGFEWKVGSVTWGGPETALVPVQSALVVNQDGSGAAASAGRVRILKPGGSWASGDTIAFGGGAATGQLVHPDDSVAAAWMNRPIVMVGAYGPDGNQTGVSVRPMKSFTRP